MLRTFYLRILFLALIGVFPLSASAAEYIENQRFSVPETESAKSFARPYDSRFQYGLPERKSSMSVFGRKEQSVDTTSDEDDVVLDATDVTPQRKVIKKITADPAEQPTNSGRNDVPMNYDSFPKFYNSNDMMNQQFMPMMSY